MELALHWQDAKRGGLEAKKEFIEFLFCNGPELDADTILFYREKCIAESEYLEIAQTYFSDMDRLDIIRKTKYKKDIFDCFTRPCNYLGRFSAAIGIVGDDQNFHTLKNLFSYKRKIIDEKGKEKVEEVMGIDACWGNIRRHLIQKLIPDLRVGCQMMYNNMHTKLSDFNAKLAESGLGKGIPLGDPYAIPRAKMVSAATKLNIVNRLGDCAKLWQHMRSFNPFDPTQNKKGPVPASAIVGGKNINGIPTTRPEPASIKNHLSETDLKKLAAQGDREAKEILDRDDYLRCQEKITKQVQEEFNKYGDALAYKHDVEVADIVTEPQITPASADEIDVGMEFAADSSATGMIEMGNPFEADDMNAAVQDMAEAMNEKNSGNPNTSTPEIIKQQKEDMKVQ